MDSGEERVLPRQELVKVPHQAQCLLVQGLVKVPHQAQCLLVARPRSVDRLEMVAREI